MTVRFTDTSRNNPESWMWDFNNDGRIESKLENPVHTYSEPGSYTVTLVATNSAGSDNETKSAYITVEKRITPPVAAFSAGPLAGYAPLTVHFTDISRNNPVSWQWDFTNDGKADTMQENPDYTYPEPGVYSVRLTVGNSGGSDELLENDYVTVLAPVTPVEDTSAGATLNAASPSITVLTSAVASITATRTTLPGSTSAPSSVADTGKTPDYSFLWIALIGGIILGGSYLWHRSRETPASTGEMPDLHVEMSGGIEFSEEITGGGTNDRLEKMNRDYEENHDRHH